MMDYYVTGTTETTDVQIESASVAKIVDDTKLHLMEANEVLDKIFNCLLGRSFNGSKDNTPDMNGLLQAIKANAESSAILYKRLLELYGCLFD